tara:strand:- start:522 stop:1394 length:873 start_codon:yes stop_codon:yes gene_type:complete
MNRKGIILAGGNGSRLSPITKSVSKQLLPVYDKPMIYYPLTTLMLAGIKDILIITNERDIQNFVNLLGDGSSFGISIRFAVQSKPEGIAQAFLIGDSFIKRDPVALVLGDNLFHGDKLVSKIVQASKNIDGATIFGYPVSDPERYGVIEFDSNRKVLSIEEKPKRPKSRYAITGLYFFDSSVVEKARKVTPSNRGELEITDIHRMYLNEGLLNVSLLGRGMTWLDTGTFDSLNDASSYIRTLENRQGLKVGCPEEVAWRQGWIDSNQTKKLAERLTSSGYGNYLLQLLGS